MSGGAAQPNLMSRADPLLAETIDRPAGWDPGPSPVSGVAYLPPSLSCCRVYYLFLDFYASDVVSFSLERVGKYSGRARESPVSPS